MGGWEAECSWGEERVGCWLPGFQETPQRIKRRRQVSRSTGVLKFYRQGSPLHTKPEAGSKKGTLPAPFPGARFPGLIAAQFLFCWMRMRWPGQEETNT